MAKMNPTVENLKNQMSPDSPPPPPPAAPEKAAGDTEGVTAAFRAILQETIDTLKKERDSFRLEFIAAKEELAKVKEELKTRSIENKASTTPTAPTEVKEIPATSDTPPEGMIRQKVQVTLPHCASRIVFVDHSPGNEIAVRDIAVAKFNEYFGILSTEHSHNVNLAVDKKVG